MNITLTITASPELLEALQGIAKGFAPKSSPASTKQTKKEEPKEEATAPAAETKETPVISIEKIREAVKAKSEAGKREEIKSLLGEFGADKVPALKPDDYPMFLEKLKAI